MDAHALKLAGQLQQSYEEAVNQKARPLSPAEVFADWDTVAGRLDQGTEVVALGVDDDEPGPASALNQRFIMYVH